MRRGDIARINQTGDVAVSRLVAAGRLGDVVVDFGAIPRAPRGIFDAKAHPSPRRCRTSTPVITSPRAYALSVEKLAGIEVPERAEYLRVILAELTRLQNHASLLGFLLSDMGAWGTPLMYAFREREKILDLFESLSGSRMMCDYMRFGGCRVDAGPDWIERAKKVV
ncbi:MAG: hypothetical protein H0U23_03285, partial [Blastocatellia bacterium]|nr:hypothetical protein [Blastocatellia bacterium]